MISACSEYLGIVIEISASCLTFFSQVNETQLERHSTRRSKLILTEEHGLNKRQDFC